MYQSDASKIAQSTLLLLFCLMLVFSCSKDEGGKEDIDDPENPEVSVIKLLEPGNEDHLVPIYSVFSWVVQEENKEELFAGNAGDKFNLYLGKTPDPPYFSSNEATYGFSTNYIIEQGIILSPISTYYWKVEHVGANDEVVARSEVASFTTVINKDVPSVRIIRLYDYWSDSFVAEMKVDHQGLSAITERGICASKSRNPNTEDIHAVGFQGDFKFHYLEPNTTYYVRAYAKNNYGVGYSKEYIVKTLETGSVTDNSGNVYKTVKIGNKWWMAENLRTKKYNNGDYIGEDLVAPSKKYALLNYDEGEDRLVDVNTYGYLYSWHTIMDTRGLCPDGWRVPTKADFEELEECLGDDPLSAERLRSSRNWNNNILTKYMNNRTDLNLTGFSAYGSGKITIRDANNSPYRHGHKKYACYWTSDQTGGNVVYFQLDMNLNSNNDLSKNDGLSLRLVKDENQ